MGVNDTQNEEGEAVTDELSKSVFGRDITKGFIGLDGLEPDTDPILTGVIHNDWTAYEQIKTDDQVKAVWQQRRIGVTSRAWYVVEGADDAQSKAAADFLREQLEALNWDDTTDKMLSGVFYGYGVAECLWGVNEEGNRITLKRVKVRKP
jgi:hypothetical protein